MAKNESANRLTVQPTIKDSSTVFRPTFYYLLTSRLVNVRFALNVFCWNHVHSCSPPFHELVMFHVQKAAVPSVEKGEAGFMFLHACDSTSSPFFPNIDRVCFKAPTFVFHVFHSMMSRKVKNIEKTSHGRMWFRMPSIVWDLLCTLLSLRCDQDAAWPFSLRWPQGTVLPWEFPELVGTYSRLYYPIMNHPRQHYLRFPFHPRSRFLANPIKKFSKPQI